MTCSWTDAISKAISRRQPLLKVTNALRWVNGSGDGLDGLVIDQYHRHFRVLIYLDHWLSEIDQIKKFLIDRWGAGYIAFRLGTREGRERFLDVCSPLGARSQTTVTENGFHFFIDLDDPLKVGLFLDMRANRQKMGRLAQGRSVLNCFSYTCSFGVYCRKMGSSRVVNLDISKKALEWGQKNYELNQIHPREDEFVKKDVFEYLRRAEKIHNGFDIIILDPPSFSRFNGRVFTVEKDFEKLAAGAIKILNPNGHLLLSTNHSGWTHRHLIQLSKKVFGLIDRKIKNITEWGQDIDFYGSGRMKESHLAGLLIHV